MKAWKIWAGRVPPVAFFMDWELSLPTHTPRHQIGGEAHEPGVMEILGGAGLAGGGALVQPRRLAGAGQ